jgi:hypothetical protein
MYQIKKKKKLSSRKEIGHCLQINQTVQMLHDQILFKGVDSIVKKEIKRV